MIKPATLIVHWPGKDTPACEDHAQKLQSLADVMGFTLSATPCFEEKMCANCENEAKKAAETAA
jgi:hypothetical protein